MVMGDFNKITRIDEMVRQVDRNATQMALFREALLDCELNDLGFTGSALTWSNNRDQNALVRARLDRVVVDSGWMRLFPLAIISHLVVAYSDHMGLLVDTNGSSGVQRGERR